MLCLAKNMESGQILTSHVIRSFIASTNKVKKIGENNRVIINVVYETAMFRIQTLFGDRLHARLLNTQVTEALIRCKALNKMSALGMPLSYSID